MNHMKLIVCAALALAVMLGLSGVTPLRAADGPGLQIAIPFLPDYIRFPDSYEEKVPALYQAHLSLQKYPRLMAALIQEREQRESEIVKDSTLNPIAKREKYDLLVAEMDAKQAAVRREEAEMRRGFLLLARDYLLEQVDPYILFFGAQIYYPIRHESAEATRRELEAAAKAEAENGADGDAPQAAPDTTAQPEASPAPEGQAEPEKQVRSTMKPSLAGKNPAMAVAQEFSTNFERMVAALEEIRERFPNFEHMHAVVRYLAVLKGELGQKDQMVALIREFLSKYRNSPYYGEMLFRLAEWKFETPFAFDRYSQAAETYEEALKVYTEPSRERWQTLYKLAWAIMLSPDLSATALEAFVRLYKEIHAQPHMTFEMQMMRIEAIEVIKRIRAVEHPANVQSGDGLFGL